MTFPGHLRLRLCDLDGTNARLHACDSPLHLEGLAPFIYAILYSPVLQSNLQHAIVGGIGPVCCMLTASEQILCGLCGFFK